MDLGSIYSVIASYKKTGNIEGIDLMLSKKYMLTYHTQTSRI